jgi:hypothetical protein
MSPVVYHPDPGEEVRTWVFFLFPDDSGLEYNEQELTVKYPAGSNVPLMR